MAFQLFNREEDDFFSALFFPLRLRLVPLASIRGRCHREEPSLTRRIRTRRRSREPGRRKRISFSFSPRFDLLAHLDLFLSTLFSFLLSAAPVLPADFEDSTWLRLKAAVAAIHAQKPSPTTFEDLYRVRDIREELFFHSSLFFFSLSSSGSKHLPFFSFPSQTQDVEALCLHGMADRLYARLASAVDAHVGSELQALSERAKTASAATTTAPAGAGSESGDYGAEDSSRALFFLPQFDATWRSHCTCMLTLRQVFAPLDAATATGSAANRGGGGANTSAAAGKAVAASPSSFSTSSAAAAAAAAASVVAARQPLHEMGLALFRAHLSAHPEVATRAAAGLLATVAAERRLSGAAAEAAMAAATGVEIPHGLPSSAAPSAPATPVDRGLAASVSRALAALSLYQRALEAPLLARSDAFYRAEGSRLLACPALPPALYLRHAERRLAEEAERALAYLERGTRAPLMKVAEAQLLARHIPALLEAGVPAFFDADLPLGGGGGGRGGGGGGGGEEAMATDDGAAAPPPPPAAATSSAAAAADQLLRNRVGISGDGLDDLRRLSAAASRVRASDALRAAFKAHVKSRGEGLMMAAAAPASAGGDAAAAASASKRLIPDLLLLKARADAAVRGAFGSREAFAVALKEAFEGFINRQGGRAAELLAKHVDAELRGGASGMKASDRAAAAAAAAAASKQPDSSSPRRPTSTSASTPRSPSSALSRARTSSRPFTSATSPAGCSSAAETPAPRLRPPLRRTATPRGPCWPSSRSSAAPGSRPSSRGCSRTSPCPRSCSRRSARLPRPRLRGSEARSPRTST